MFLCHCMLVCILWLAVGPHRVFTGIHHRWKQQEQQRVAHTDPWMPMDDSNATCAPPHKRTPVSGVVAIGAPFFRNITSAVLLIPIVATIWHHHGWQPLLLTVGDGWKSKVGQRVLAEVHCIPFLRRHLAKPTIAQPGVVLAVLLDGLPNTTVLRLSAPNLLPSQFAAKASAGAHGSDNAVELSDWVAAEMSVWGWRRLLPAATNGSITPEAAALLHRLWPPWMGQSFYANQSPRGKSSSGIHLHGFQLSQWPTLQQQLRLHRLLPLDDLQRIQRFLFEVQAPACHHNIPRQRQGKARFFYFGITYPDTHFLLEACHATWTQAIPGMVWYSVAPHPLVTHVLPDNVRIIRRIGTIWEHIHRHYAGYDWYVRCWEDNYIFPHRLEQVALKFRPSEPLQIGHIGWLKHHRFLLGGPPGLWSRASFQLLVTKYGANFSRCLPLCRADPFITSRMEDVCWSLCARKAGIRLISHCGFPFEAPFLFHVGLSETDVACGFPTTDDRHSSQLACSTDPA
eukprot:GGOE01017783.1.p1 GENE.GGOE01017783.1~~GGOE01017783.1.p1  ORF type:complete len:512 (+),score=85.88 GGOE01017783.1:26-1561(+)